MANFGDRKKFNVDLPGKVGEGVKPGDEIPAANASMNALESFVAGSPDTPPDTARVPNDGRAWRKNERSAMSLMLSPPQKKALELVSGMHRKAQQEYLVEALERWLITELQQLSRPEMGGIHASEARVCLGYLTEWGDLNGGRNRPGRLRT